MFESKYSKLLTVILVIVIIAIIGLLGFLGYDYYKNYIITADTSDFVENFKGEVVDEDENESESKNEGTTEEEKPEEPEETENPFDKIEDNKNTGSSNGGTAAQRPQFKGFGVLGTMEIPAIKFSYPVLDKVTKKSIETSVAFLYGTGINEPGNSVIIGHNYRNGMFFSNNKKLKVGDQIFITDNSGKKLTYTIYNKFEASDTDTSFYQRDTGGKPEVTLSTCTDDSKARLIILARAE